MITRRHGLTLGTTFAAVLAAAGLSIAAAPAGAASPGGLCEGLDLTGVAATDDDATADDADAGELPDGSGVGVAVLFDVTGRGDRSFNDAAAAGLDRATADFGITPSESTPSGDGDRADRLSAAAEGGNALVVAVGFLWADNVTQGAAAYPDTHFGIIDSVVEADNVASLVFAEHEGSFLVGAAAALASESGTVGYIGGVPFDLIKKFEAGYTAGAKCINPDIEVLVEYISDDPAIGFNDPTRGGEIAKAMYDAGADVVYAAAGGSGLGVLEAAAAAGEPGEVWNIGVDSDLYEQVDEALQPYVLTSMLKRVDVATYTAIAAEVAGEFTGGVQVFDLSVDGVGYSTSGGFVDEYVPTLEALKAYVIDGTIEVPSVPEP